MSNKYNYKLTPLADEDIASALTYISKQLFNAKAADDLFTKIENTIERICEFPYSFSNCSCFLINDENIRHAIVDNYVLIYEVVEEKTQINILRFRYAKMNLTKMSVKDKE